MKKTRLLLGKQFQNVSDILLKLSISQYKVFLLNECMGVGIFLEVFDAMFQLEVGYNMTKCFSLPVV